MVIVPGVALRQLWELLGVAEIVGLLTTPLTSLRRAVPRDGRAVFHGCRSRDGLRTPPEWTRSTLGMVSLIDVRTP